VVGIRGRGQNWPNPERGQWEEGPDSFGPGWKGEEITKNTGITTSGVNSTKKKELTRPLKETKYSKVTSTLRGKEEIISRSSVSRTEEEEKDRSDEARRKAQDRAGFGRAGMTAGGRNTGRGELHRCS